MGWLRSTATPPKAVKPIALMRWLITLVTPKGGTILDPFCGSGSTGCAAAQLGVDFIGIEQDPEYAAIAERRIAHWAEHGDRPVKAVKIGPKTEGVYAGGKGRRTLARCPDHGKPQQGGPGTRVYTCGCRAAYDVATQEHTPESPHPQLPLFAAAD
jgi:hypothetical protein